jgi:alkanesulfonate monooxygenase SsuD/methylene tetrahydromethanopterin reductase-like flavin-dependent oxidoreductase (luciferase family)
MEFGLFSNGQRHNTVAALTYDEDLHEIAVADELGFSEAWISEHGGGNRPDQLPAADLMICAAANRTRQIKLGPGIRALPYHHPLQVAAEAAVCDHLTGGRYLFGFGTGTLPQLAQQRGVDREQSRAMAAEAIDLILRAWTAPEPFDHHGQYWQGQNINVTPRPLQQPHMPVGVACFHTVATAEMAGQRGFLPLISQYSCVRFIRELAEAFDHGSRAAGRQTDRCDLRVCRYIYVAEDAARAKRELRESVNRGIAYNRSLGQFDEVLAPGDRREQIDFDYLVDHEHFYVGDPDHVTRCVERLYDETGGFGLLMLLVGKDWGTREQRERSMRLFAEHVAPRLAPLDPGAVPLARPRLMLSGSANLARSPLPGDGI